MLSCRNYKWTLCPLSAPLCLIIAQSIASQHVRAKIGNPNKREAIKPDSTRLIFYHIPKKKIDSFRIDLKVCAHRRLCTYCEVASLPPSTPFPLAVPQPRISMRCQMRKHTWLACKILWKGVFKNSLLSSERTAWFDRQLYSLPDTENISWTIRICFNIFIHEQRKSHVHRVPFLQIQLSNTDGM